MLLARSSSILGVTSIWKVCICKDISNNHELKINRWTRVMGNDPTRGEEGRCIRDACSAQTSGRWETQHVPWVDSQREDDLLMTMMFVTIAQKICSNKRRRSKAARSRLADISTLRMSWCDPRLLDLSQAEKLLVIYLQNFEEGIWEWCMTECRRRFSC